ncbi:MAG: hypothetical protein HYZ21_01975 [Chloroflexi bacterium]|nr:hypothetical protein [Chloroflexota bacterium]
MSELTPDPFAFEAFPRGWLAFRITRRQFLPGLLDNIHAYCADAPAHGLDELGTWDNEKLGSVIPKINPGVKVSVKDRQVYGQPKTFDKPLRLFATNSPALHAFNQMNGFNSLREIANSMAEENHWSCEHSFNYARGLFLWLVLCLICEPLLPK